MKGHVERPGLYIMVFLILLNSCETTENVARIISGTDQVKVCALNE